MHDVAVLHVQYSIAEFAETAKRKKNCENLITMQYLLHTRDGMVKRPGNESYLMKVVEEERKAYSQGLEVFSPSEEGEGDGDTTGSEPDED